MKPLLAACALFLLSPAPAHAQGTVSTADPRATAAGVEILRQGGTATDAAIAVMLALTVVEPQSSGIGGGGFLVHHDADTGLTETIDGRETAPTAATPERFLGPDGKPLPFSQAFPGGLSVGVPGNVRLAELAHRKWGRLPWARLFTPAIRLAEEGFEVTPPLADRLRQSAPMWKGFPELAAIYLDRDGNPPPVGARIRNPQLAGFLRRLAAAGPDAFYAGANAEAVVRTVRTAPVNPGDMTPADLASYRAKQRPAVCGHYRRYKICGMGPPSAGATTVIGILGMLEKYDLKALGKDSPVAWHLIGEAARLVYADRDKYLSDPDFQAVPVAGLIDPGYLSKRAGLIARTHVLGAYRAGNPPGARAGAEVPQEEVPGTTHFVAVDDAGDIVSMTSTVEGPFGSQLVAGGYVLNNELTDFSFAPADEAGRPVANRVEGGKRPVSSMAPTIVYDANDRPIFVVGAAGGRTIPMQVTKTIIAHLDWGLPAREAIGAPVLYFNRDGLVLEQGTPLAAMAPALERLGHKVTTAVLPLKCNAAELTPSGWVGAADPRSVGTTANP